MNNDTPSRDDVAKRSLRNIPGSGAETASSFSVTVGQVYDGPFDLLLDLIRKQNVDIHDIPIARITAQFLEYTHRVKQSDVDAAADFLYTASVLIQIKSKVLLPVDASKSGATDEGDPRQELVDRLLEHERFKAAGQMLLERQLLQDSSWTSPGGRRVFSEDSASPVSSKPPGKPKEDTINLVDVFQKVIDRLRDRPRMRVNAEPVTVEKMVDYLKSRLALEECPVSLGQVLHNTTSSDIVVAMFLATLELVRAQAVLVHQPVPGGEVYLKKTEGFPAVCEQAAVGTGWQ